METCVTIADRLDKIRVNMRVSHGKKSVVVMKTNFKTKEQRAFVDVISQCFEMWFQATITEKSDKNGNCVLTCETINGKHMFLAIANIWSIFEKEIVLNY